MATNPKLTDGETVVVDTRTHWKAILWPAIVLIVTLAVADLPRPPWSATSTSRWVVWIIAVGVLVVWSVKPFLEWLTATYTITTKRLITREGLIARRGHDIPLLRISDVAYDMGPIDRMLGLRHARDQRRQHPRLRSSSTTSPTSRPCSTS